MEELGGARTSGAASALHHHAPPPRGPGTTLAHRSQPPHGNMAGRRTRIEDVGSEIEQEDVASKHETRCNHARWLCAWGEEIAMRSGLGLWISTIGLLREVLCT